MKKIAAIIIASILTTAFSADMNAARQTGVQLKGSVVDTNGEAVAFATVALIKADSTIVAGNATDIEGKFTLQAAGGEYTLSVSMIGYKEESISVALNSLITELPPIVLQDDAQMLEGAVVTDRVNLVEMKMDKIVMNVSQSAFAQGNTGLELIKKAPGVTIDKDGNIKLNGKSVSVWIDGRPSHLDGKSLEALLRSTNGESIDKFELMPNPSSKYDAEGQGGIINIKTKKNGMSGFNGSMGLNGGGMYFKKPESRFLWQESYWANLNYRGKKTNTFVNLYEGIYNTDLDFSTSLKTKTTAGELTQETSSYSANRYSNMNIKVGNDWFINDRNTFGVIVTLPGSISNMGAVKGRDFNGISTQAIDGVDIYSEESRTDNDSKSLQGSANLNYTHVFNEARASELTANLDYYRTQSHSLNEMQTEVTPVSGDPFNSFKTIDNSFHTNIYSAKVDYQSIVWKNAMLEAGGKWSLSMTGNNMSNVNNGTKTSSDFTYNESVGALYVSLAKPLTQKLSMKAGLRGEYTWSRGSWNEKPRQYFDVFPTFYMGYNHSEKLMMSLSYTRRIRRPGYYSLNPAEEFVDSHSSTAGNPLLTPQYNNSVYGNTVFFKYYSFTLGYDHTKDMFTQAPSYKENGDQFLTWGNYGKNDMAFASANISALPIAKWLQWTLNATYIFTHSISSEGAKPQNAHSCNVYTDLTFVLPKDWKIQLDAYYNTPMMWGYFKMQSMWGSNFGIKKTMLDGRLSLSLDVDDIFRSSNMIINMLSEDANVQDSQLRQKFLDQKVKLGLTWTFGKAQAVKYRKVGSIDESSRLGGSGGGSGIGNK